MEINKKTIKKAVDPSKQINSYKEAVMSTYDKNLPDAINLINGCEKEEYDMYKTYLDSAINMCGAFLPNYSSLINKILGTTYTDEELWKIVEPYIIDARKALEHYISETRLSKRKLNKVQEMRKEMDEAKAIFDKLAQKKEEPKNEPKLTIWQKIKRFFSCKKCNK